MSEATEADAEAVVVAGHLRLTFIGDVPDEAAIAELREWLAIEEDEAGPRLDPDVVNALAIDALTVAALHGVVGNFTYDLFPWAGRFVRRMRRGSSAIDAEAVTALVLTQACHHAADPRAARLVSIGQDVDRSWTAEVAVTDGQKQRTVQVRVSESGQVVASKRR